jgi:hypothetical protein
MPSVMTEICCCIPKPFIRRRTIAPAFKVLGLDATAKARARFRGTGPTAPISLFLTRQLLAVPRLAGNVRDWSIPITPMIGATDRQ